MDAITADVDEAGREQGPAVVGAWVWVSTGTPAAPLARFARARGLPEAYVSVPWLGPDDDTRAMVGALRAAGVEVHALGGDPGWALDPALARTWAGRAHAHGLFTGTHLDCRVDAARLGQPRRGAVGRCGEGSRRSHADVARSAGRRCRPLGCGRRPCRVRRLGARRRRHHVHVVPEHRREHPPLLGQRTLRHDQPAAALPAGRRHAACCRPIDDIRPTTGISTARRDRCRLVASAGRPHFHGIAVHDLLGWSRLPRSGPGPVHHC